MKFMTATNAALALLGALVLLAAPASSQDAKEKKNDFDRNGVYLGGSVIGGNYIRFDRGPGDPEADIAIGGGALVGYRANPAIAFEAEFEILPSVDVDINGINPVAELETWAITANSKIFWGQDRFQPYSLIGLGIMHTMLRNHSPLSDTMGLGFDGSELGFLFRFGIGMDYYITRNVVATIGADYLLPAAEVQEDYDLVTYGVGMQYRF